MRSNHRCHSKLVRAGSTPTFSLMHLLVPGAYRRVALKGGLCSRNTRLNAPSGAGCLPTQGDRDSATGLQSLNAPSGAGCLPTRRRPGFGNRAPKSQCTFWCRVLTDWQLDKLREAAKQVSMHLLVPGAYRLLPTVQLVNSSTPSQCTFWCRVLTDLTARAATGAGQQSQCPSGAGCLPTRRYAGPRRKPGLSQCTFWCRVLTDPARMRPAVRRACLNAPSGAGCLPTLPG